MFDDDSIELDRQVRLIHEQESNAPGPASTCLPCPPRTTTVSNALVGYLNTCPRFVIQRRLKSPNKDTIAPNLSSRLDKQTLFVGKTVK